MQNLLQTRESLSQYYTSCAIGDLLVDSIDFQLPKTIIDLGVGSGSLFQAASRKWADATLISVDIDKSNFLNVSRKYPGHIHLYSDAISNDYANPLKAFKGMVDVAICNPPYIHRKWQKSFGNILEEASLLNVLPNMSDAASDLIFLAQNLRMLKTGGELGIIIPDGIITADRYTKLRSTLLENHFLKNIIQLPSGVFQGTQANAFILTLNKGKPTGENVALYKASTKGVLSRPVIIETQQAVERMDYDFHSWKQSSGKLISSKKNILKNVGQINRGSVGNSSAVRTGLSVFHTTDFKKIANINAFELSSEVIVEAYSRGFITAKAGDILLSRVGRSLETQMAYVTKGEAILSDCVYRIRLPEALQKSAWESLSSNEGRTWVKALVKGTGVKILAKKDLEQFKF